MGRMLDALNRNDWPVVEPPTPAADATPAPEEDGGTEEVPYIEVGAPARKIEASPSVWVASTVRAPVEPAAAKKPTLEMPQPRPVTLTPRPPMTLSLKPAAPAQSARPRLAPEVIAYHQPDHAVSQQYRELLRHALAEVGGDGGQTLLLAALTPGAGTTTAVLNLAVCAATDPDRQVVVVDANWQRPVLGRRLGLAAGPGLQEVLAGTAALEQVIQKTDQDRLFALPAGAVNGRLSVPGGAAGGWVLRWLRERYDLVLLDGPAWPAGDDLAELAAEVDVVYLVLDEGQAGKAAV